MVSFEFLLFCTSRRTPCIFDFYSTCGRHSEHDGPLTSSQARTKQTARKTVAARTLAKAPVKGKKIARKSMPTRREQAPDRATQVQRAMRKVKRGTRALQCVSSSALWTCRASCS